VLNAKGYSERDEKRILDTLGRGLLKEFPNPERTGCPGSDVLKRIAFHEMPLAEAEKWLDHLTSCSPCYGDFSQFRSAYRKRRSRTLFAIAASILIVAGVASWVLFLRQRQPVATEAAVLDLRNRSVPRGTESNPAEPRLEIGRNVSRMEVYLPLGSADGVYELSIRSQEGSPVFTGSGMAKIKEGITSLSLDVNLSSASSGLYVLQLRKVGSEWNSYPMMLR
jgi:hypothetical protein